jgi:HEAT repeat protein
VREIARKQGPNGIPEIAAYLKDPERDVRLEAVEAIERVGTMAALDPLITATKDADPRIRVQATDGIVGLYVPGYVNKNSLSGRLVRGAREVKAFFAARNDEIIDPDVVIRPDAAQAIADEIGNGASMEPRTNAALAAGILRDRTAVPELVKALRSQDSDLIFESLIALQKIRDKSAGASAAFLVRDLDNRVQITALDTVGVLGNADATPDVRYAFNRARNVKIQRAALGALAMFGQAQDRPIFQQYSNNGDAELRAAALEGLGRVREPADNPVLQTSFDEPNTDWRVHLAAAFALVSEGNVSTAEFSPLLYLIENLDARVQGNTAAAYLTELIRRQDVRQHIGDTLEGATKYQKIALCSILGSSQSDDVQPLLDKLAGDRDLDVSFAAKRGLRILKAHKPS